MIGAWLAATAGAIAVAVALLARYEVLAYAAGWHRAACELPAHMPYASGASADRPPEGYLVYLDGIGKMRFRDSRDGVRLVDEVVARAPELRVLGHVLPYSPLARPLVERRGAPWLQRHAIIALFLYNVMQILVAADARYRPFYNRAVGGHVTAQLRRAGYVPGSGTPLVLLGYSGGAQVATGAVTDVSSDLDAPVTVILLGGFHSGTNDLRAANALHELVSDHDPIERLGRWIFPARWPCSTRSPWCRARRAGKVRVHHLDPAHHVGPSSYISPTAHLPDGHSYLERTALEIVAIAHAHTAAQESSTATEPREADPTRNSYSQEPPCSR